MEITDTNFLKQKSCHDEQPDDFWCCFSALHPQLLSGKNTARNLFLIYINNMCSEDKGFQFILLPLHLGHDPLHALCWKPVMNISLFMPSIPNAQKARLKVLDHDWFEQPRKCPVWDESNKSNKEINGNSKISKSALEFEVKGLGMCFSDLRNFC